MKRSILFKQFILLLLLAFIVFIPPLFAKGKESSSLITGYCCYKGSVVQSDQAQCKKKGGDYYPTKAQADKNCQPDTTYCCIKNKVTEISSEKCKKYGGTSHKSKAEAVKACQPEEVYCCLNGEVDKIPLEKCKNGGGKAFKTKSEAQKECEPEEIYCCLKGEINKMSHERCKRGGGTSYRNKAEALKMCRPDEVYCCIDGQIRTVSGEECKKRGGDGYTTKSEAVRHCGWCCADSNVFPASPEECRKRRGSYFASKGQAEEECREEPKCCINGQLFDYQKLECERRNGRYFRSGEEAEKECQPDSGRQDDLKRRTIPTDAVRLPVDRVRPKVLPDLTVVQTDVNRSCYMTVKVKNIGGAISPAEHSAATIHLSAGPDQVSGMTRLSDIDPGGTLRSPGGEVTKTTKLRITKANQATLVWVDTGHAIVESDEINNGDDALLTCKTPLLWCCARGKVGQATAEECKRGKGTAHKTEQEANKACGIRTLRETRMMEKSGQGIGTIPPLMLKTMLRPNTPRCCLKDNLFSMNEQECSESGGQYLTVLQAMQGMCGSTKIVPKRLDLSPDQKRMLIDQLPITKAMRRESPLPSGDGDEEPVGEPAEAEPTEAEVGGFSIEVYEAGEVIRPGSTISAHYTFGDPQPAEVRITLRRYDGGAMVEEYSRYEGAPRTSYLGGYYAELGIPFDVDTSTFRVSVTTVGESSSRGGESTDFTVTGGLSHSPPEMNVLFSGTPSWYATPVDGDDWASVDISIICEGEGCAGQDVPVTLYQGGVVATTATLSANSGSFSQTLLDFEPVCGSEIQVVIDPDNVLTESNETDNSWTTTDTCIHWPETDKPDLLITSASVSPSPLTHLEPSTIRYSIRNSERYASVPAGPFSVGLRKPDGSFVGVNPISGLEPGEVIDGTFTWWVRCDPADPPLVMVADISNDVDEADETNNEETNFHFECVPSRTNLFMSGAGASDRDTDIEAGRLKNFNVDVWSVGGDPRSVNVRCGIVGGAELYNHTFASLPTAEIDPVRRGERAEFSTTLCPADTVFRFYCEVDPANTIVESDESDNRVEFEVITYSSPHYSCP